MMNLTREELELIALYQQPTRRGTLAALRRIPHSQVEDEMQDLLLDACTHLEQMSDREFQRLKLDEVLNELEEMEEEDGGEVD